MKNLILASLIAVTSVMSFGVPAEAASAALTNVQNVQYVHRGYGPRYYGPRYGRYYGPHRYGRYCRIETIRHHRYGRWWVERVRVCS
jgi:hypothetical protein